jgi:hypothetical protein
MIDYAVEYRAERFFYWVSTQYRGILVFNEKGGMLGSQLEIPLGTKKVNLGNHPASMVRNIGGDIFFAVNAKEDSNTEAFILFYSKKDKGWKKLPNPQKEIYYYQYMEKHGPWLTLIYDTGEKTGVSLLDLSKIQQGTARYPFNIKADELFVKGTADQKNLYLADLEGNVIRYNLGDNGEKGSEKGNE